MQESYISALVKCAAVIFTPHSSDGLYTLPLRSRAPVCGDDHESLESLWGIRVAFQCSFSLKASQDSEASALHGQLADAFLHLWFV